MRTLLASLFVALPLGAAFAQATPSLALAPSPVSAAPAAEVDQTLPAPSVHFTAVTEPSGRVSLVWTAAYERPGTTYAVERSTDNQRFVELDSLASEQEVFGTYFPSVYFFLDRPRPQLATCYYRLRQTTKEGAVLYSDVEAVEPSTAPVTVARAWLYPNPVPADATPMLRYAGAQGRVLTVTVTDLSGRVHLVHSLSPATSEASAPLLPEGAHLPAGVYQVKVNGTTSALLTKLIIK
jgi:hypothetical protein